MGKVKQSDIERLKEVRDQISSINGVFYTKGIIELMIEEKEILSFNEVAYLSKTPRWFQI